MATYRVEKNKNYTVMSNYHLRDARLSLKTRGLLSILLSLPDSWAYSIEGLQKITGEGRDSIKKCLKELQANGYLIITQTRDTNGRMSKNEYVIYEEPRKKGETAEISPLTGNPSAVNTSTANPSTVNPSTAEPSAEKLQQLNTNEQITEKQNTKSINHSSDGDTIDGIETYERVQHILKENVGFDVFVSKARQAEQKFEDGLLSVEEFDESICEYNPDIAARVLRYMTDLVAGRNISPTVMINGVEIPADVVKSKLLKVDFTQFKKVVKELCVNPTIKNQKKYAISMLYNS